MNKEYDVEPKKVTIQVNDIWGNMKDMERFSNFITKLMKRKTSKEDTTNE